MPGFNLLLRVPLFLSTIDDPRAIQGGSFTGCPVCGGKFDLVFNFVISHDAPGLGHGISNCPKLEDAQRRQMASHRTTDEGGGY